MEISILAISIVAYSQVPNKFPLLPYLSTTEISNHLCVYKSLKNFEIPEWNPYLGGGFPLSPSTRYTFFYGINRVTFALIVSALTLMCLVAERTKRASSIVVMLSYLTSLLSYSPVPIGICMLAVGIINNSKIIRMISSMIIPSLSLIYELSLKDKSIIVILSSLVGVADVILANAFSPHAIPIIDNPPTAVEIAVNSLVYLLIFVPSFIIIYALSKVISKINSRTILISYIVMFLINFIECTYTSIMLASAPIVLISAMKVLRKVKLEGSLSTIYNLSIISTGLIIVGTISMCSSPHAAISHVKVLGEGVPIVITANPYFDIVNSYIYKNEIVANPPSVPFTPLSRSASSFLNSIKATSPLPLGIYPTTHIDTKFKFLIPVYISPKIYTLKSVTFTQACEIIKNIENRAKVKDPIVISPRIIRCNGLTFQQYSIWWSHAKFYDYMIYSHGNILYNRPSAESSILLQPIMLVYMIIRRRV